MCSTGRLTLPFSSHSVDVWPKHSVYRPGTTTSTADRRHVCAGQKPPCVQEHILNSCTSQLCGSSITGEIHANVWKSSKIGNRSKKKPKLVKKGACHAQTWTVVVIMFNLFTIRTVRHQTSLMLRSLFKCNQVIQACLFYFCEILDRGRRSKGGSGLHFRVGRCEGVLWV